MLAPDTANGSTAITPIADVTTTLTAPSSANAGSTVNVPITFTNNGPSTAAGVTYSATLPSGLSGVSCTGATCAYNSGTGAITITGLAGSLTNGQTQNITLSYTAPATGPVAVSSTIATTTSEGANVAPDTANGSTAITPIADVTTTLTAPASANAGSTVNVPITFTNNGPSTAANVSYSATLPTGLSGVVCTGTGISLHLQQWDGRHYLHGPGNHADQRADTESDPELHGPGDGTGGGQHHHWHNDIRGCQCGA